MSEPLRRSAQLRVSGVHATWEPDPERDGAWVLFVGGEEQSTLFPATPARLVYEYLARMGHALDLTAPAGAPLRVLHLGGGALTFPRYVEATRPGSTQTVVDLDSELMPFVLDSFPLAHPELAKILIGDVRELLAEAAGDGPFDVTVLDIALGPDSPARLLEQSFAAELVASVTREGLLLVNIGDDPPLRTTHALVRAFRAAGASVWVTAQADMFTGRYAGNLVLGASRRRWPEAKLEALQAAGPHPAGLLAGLDLDGLGEP